MILLHLTPLTCSYLLDLSTTMEKPNFSLTFSPFPGKQANNRLQGEALQDNPFAQGRRNCCVQVHMFQQWFCDASSRSFCDNLIYGLFLLTFAPVLGTKRKYTEEWVLPFWLLEHGHLCKGMWLPLVGEMEYLWRPAKGICWAGKSWLFVGGKYLIWAFCMLMSIAAAVEMTDE